MCALGRLGLLIGLSLFASGAFAQNYVPGEVIVKLRSQKGSEASYAFLGKASMNKQMVLKNSWGKLSMYHFKLSKGQSVQQAIAELQKDPDVEYAEPNYLLTASEDTGLQQAYSQSEVQAFAQSGEISKMQSDYGLTAAYKAEESVSAQSTLASRPIVAVIDTGLDLTHPVMTGTSAVWTNPGEIPANGIDDDGNGYVDDVHGWNFVDNSSSIYDDDGHGTHVTGIILSVDQDIYSPPFETSKIQIMPLKFLNGEGVGSTSDAIKAIYYAINNGAVVLNNSWGGGSYSTALAEAVAYSYSAGATFVAAAGNNGTNNDTSPLYPASYDVPNIISVAAATDTNYLASFSNYGVATVDLASPGVYILSTLPGTYPGESRYGTESGTSMATPFVSGTAAEMKAASPSMLGYQIRNIILKEISSYSQLNGKVASNGRLNSANAISYAKTAAVDGSQPLYSLSYQNDRELASNLAGGGCGLVTKLDNGSGPPPPGGMTIALILGLLALPLAYVAYRGQTSPANRRQHERFRIESEVRINVGDKELVGSVSSISLGGVQVNTSALLQDGGLVTLSIASPDGSESVEVAGRVVWSAANKAYGVAFSETSENALSRIGRWTKSLQRT